MESDIEFWARLVESCQLDVDEGLTIPENPDDPIEKKIRAELPRGYRWGDLVIGWYRNEKKTGTPDEELEQTYVTDIPNLIDLLNTYEKFLDLYRKQKMVGKKVVIDVGEKTFEIDPIKDFTSKKLRRPYAAKLVVKALGNLVQSSTSIVSDKSKYQITEEDRNNIWLLSSTKNVMCWATREYETTNKFIYQLWQNAETLGRGDVYGDPENQTPYCTHSREHWNDYSEGDPAYTQYWFLMKTDGDFDFSPGDLKSDNVVQIFNSLKGKGKDILLAMDDSKCDFLNKYDMHSTKDVDFLPEVEKIDCFIHKEDVDEEIECALDNARRNGGAIGDEIEDGLKRFITEIDIPENVVYIHNNVFKNCTNLQRVTFHNDDFQTIANHAFSGCKKLQSIELPKTMYGLGSYTFYNCISLKDIKMPDKMQYMDVGVFEKCLSLREMTINPGLRSIPMNGFTDCYMLEKVVIGDGPTLVGSDAFYRCQHLKEVYLPDTIEEIQGQAFAYCPSLEEIRIPSKVTQLKGETFAGCRNLRKISVGKNFFWASPTAFIQANNIESFVIRGGNMEEIKERKYYPFGIDPALISVEPE